MDHTPFRLSKPLMTHQGEISELKMKPATARSFINHGSPYTVAPGEIVTPDWKATFGFVSDMTGIDDLTLNDIAAADVMPLFNAVLGMLVVRPTIG